MKRNVFLGNMIRYGYMPLAGLMLTGLLNLAVVRGNQVISAVIDRMLAGERVVFGSFLAEFAVLTALGFEIQCARVCALPRAGGGEAVPDGIPVL